MTHLIDPIQPFNIQLINMCLSYSQLLLRWFCGRWSVVWGNFGPGTDTQLIMLFALSNEEYTCRWCCSGPYQYNFSGRLCEVSAHEARRVSASGGILQQVEQSAQHAKNSIKGRHLIYFYRGLQVCLPDLDLKSSPSSKVKSVALIADKFSSPIVDENGL